MFGPSLKSVPGCLVSIVPIGIGVPVALTPGFLPHAEVLLLAPPELALVVALVLAAPLGAALELLLLLLLPQPASTRTAPTSTASAMLVRRRSGLSSVLTSVLSSNDLVEPPRFGERGS
jgi:hypothetical protein